MQNNEELNSLQSFFNKCHYSVLIKKPSWLKYYGISSNEMVVHFAIIQGCEILIRGGKFDPLLLLKMYYNNFKENPSQDAISHEYVKWKELM